MRIPTNEEIRGMAWWISRGIIFVIGIIFVSPFITTMELNWYNIKIFVGLIALGFVGSDMEREIEKYIKTKKRFETKTTDFLEENPEHN